MARAQVASKKGRNSSSTKRPGRSTQAARRARSRRPTARGMAGSKGKGRYGGRGGARGKGGPARADQRSMTSRDTGVKPEGSIQPTLVAGDATVAEQRRAASRQRSGARTDRPAGPARRKAGARGGGDFDRDAAGRDPTRAREATEGRRRRAGRGDALEMGREDLTEPTRESTRGPKPRGGEEGLVARARRAGLGFRDED